MKLLAACFVAVLCLGLASALYVPEVGPGVCVPAPGMPCDVDSYYSGSSDSSSSSSSFSSSSSSRSYYSSVSPSSVSSPCKNRNLNLCLAHCSSYSGKTQRVCIETCVDPDPGARKALSQCVAALSAVRKMQSKAALPTMRLGTPTTVTSKPITPAKIAPTAIRGTPITPTPLISLADPGSDFTIQINPVNAAIPKGGQRFYTVTVTPRGIAKPVKISLGGTDANRLVVGQKTLYGFDGLTTLSRTPPYTASLLIKTRSNVSAARYNLAVNGVSGRFQRSQPFSLSIG